MKRMNEEKNWDKKYPNFSKKELSCRGCDHNCRYYNNPQLFDPYSVKSLQKLRKSWNKPLIINSAYRCSDHNKNQGGVPTSQHRLGKAFDISTHNWSKSEIDSFIKLAKTKNFNAIGIYKDYIHIDSRDKPAFWQR